MSYVFVKYDDGELEYFEDVITSWGDDGTLMLVDIEDPKEYSWLHLSRVMKIEVSEYPHPEIDEEDYEDKTEASDKTEE